MSDGARKSERIIEGFVSTPEAFYKLAEAFGPTLTELLPMARPDHAMIFLDGANLSGTNPLPEISEEERKVAPIGFILPFADEKSGLTATFCHWLMGKDVSYRVTVDGSDEIRVIGLAEKLGKALARRAAEIEAGEPIPGPTPQIEPIVQSERPRTQENVARESTPGRPDAATARCAFWIQQGRRIPRLHGPSRAPQRSSRTRTQSRS